MTATLRYMGSKRSLAPVIAEMIDRMHPGATVADAFAGTCAVGTAVATQHPVIANDLHAYAEVVAYALLAAPGPPPTRKHAAADLEDAVRSHLRQLELIVGDRVREETQVLNALEMTGDWRPFQRFSSHALEQPVPLPLPGAAPVESYRKSPTAEPYVLCSSYFANSYFGVRQAAQIDALRYAIDQSPAARRPFYLLAFLHAVSHCGAAPGHFAQFLVPRDAANSRYIAKYRSRSPLHRFRCALASLRLPDCVDRSRNDVRRAEATEFLRRGLKDVRGELVIYADPPYSKAQYSRYYHVLETLVLYDYPEVSGKGRYRTDRVNTPFSQRSGVTAAMGDFVEAAAQTGAPLFLSYPENGLLFKAGSDPAAILRQYYRKVRMLTRASLAHSTMGGAPGSAAVDVTEHVYYAKN